MIYMIESQVAYILDCLRLMPSAGYKPSSRARTFRRAYNEEIQRRMQGTVWASGCASWYLDARGVQLDAVARLHGGISLAHSPLRSRELPANRRQSGARERIGFGIYPATLLTVLLSMTSATRQRWRNA